MSAATPSYLVPLLVLVVSLRDALGDRRVRLTLVHEGLGDEELALIAREVELDPHEVSEVAAGMPAHPRFPSVATAPLLAAELCRPVGDRVVFLDPDVLVLDDPSPLWSLDLAGKPFGATADAAIPRCSAPRGVADWRSLGIPPDAPYCNAGVLALSVSGWSAHGLTGRTRDRLAAGPQRASDFYHQEALNAVAWDAWTPLPARWNVPAAAGRWGETEGDARRPGIVHFSGRAKPWRGALAGPFGPAYAAALDRVAELVELSPPTVRDRLVAAYDRRLRALLHPLERALWCRRLL